MRMVFLLAFGGFGLAALTGGVVIGKGRLAVVQSGVVAKGSVVDFESHLSTSTDRKTNRTTQTMMYAPVVSYVDDSGQAIRFTSEASSSSRGYEIGEEVEVVYSKESPRKAFINSFYELWMAPLVLTLFGIVFMGAGVMAFRVIGKSAKTFDKAFFVHRKKNKGRFQSTRARVSKVEVVAKGNEFAAIIVLDAMDPTNGQRLTWTTPSTTYRRDKEPFSRSELEQLRGKEFNLTYDPQDISDFYFDICEHDLVIETLTKAG